MLAHALQVHEVEAPEQTLTRKAMLRRVPVPPEDSGRMPMFQEAAERMPVVQEASGRMPSLNQMRQPLQVGNRRRRVLENDLPFEFMLNVLRLREGVPSTFFSERTGMPISRINRALTQAVDRGLLDPDPRVLRATPFGWRFLNILQAMFLDLLKQGTERCGTTHQEGA
jgi:hypothetical protein